MDSKVLLMELKIKKNSQEENIQTIKEGKERGLSVVGT